MQNSPPLFLMVTVLAGVLGLAALVAGYRLRTAAPSRVMTLVSVLPALLVLALFYSLAIHMHRSLGGWPDSIGMRGFPSGLVTHADVAVGSFGILLLACLTAWPVALLLSASIRPLRGAVFYLGAFAVSCLACFAAMALAPAPFLYWWWD